MELTRPLFRPWLRNLAFTRRRICLGSHFLVCFCLLVDEGAMPVCKLQRATYANRKSYLTCVVSVSGGAFPPEFADTIQNVTVSLGRDATFTCLVNHLGGYRVSFPICQTSVKLSLIRAKWPSLLFAPSLSPSLSLSLSLSLSIYPSLVYPSVVCLYREKERFDSESLKFDLVSYDRKK